MDTETTTIFLSVLLGVTLVATLIQLPGGTLSLMISLAFCFVAGLCASIFLGTIIQWGKPASGAVYFTVFLLFFVVPAALSSALGQVLIPFLRDAGLIKWYYLLAVFVTAVLLFRYTVYYGRYEWQLISLTLGEVELLENRPFWGLKIKDQNSRSRFARHFDLLDPSRLNPIRYPSRASDNYNIQLGLPYRLNTYFYVPETDTVYFADFELPKRKIERLSAWSIIYPLYPKQKYYYLELLTADNGEVVVFVANDQESLEVFRGLASAVAPQDLPSWTTEEYHQALEKKTNKKDDVGSARPDISLLQNKFIIRHELSGDLDSIIQLGALTANGERYLVDKKYWSGRPLKKSYAVPIHLRYLTFNDDEKLIEWKYDYHAQSIVEKLNAHKVSFDSKKLNELRYTYYLRLDENKKLLATSFEYVNGEKDEFEVDARLIDHGDQYY